MIKRKSGLLSRHDNEEAFEEGGAGRRERIRPIKISDRSSRPGMISRALEVVKLVPSVGKGGMANGPD